MYYSIRTIALKTKKLIQMPVFGYSKNHDFGLSHLIINLPISINFNFTTIINPYL